MILFVASVVCLWILYHLGVMVSGIPLDPRVFHHELLGRKMPGADSLPELSTMIRRLLRQLLFL